MVLFLVSTPISPFFYAKFGGFELSIKQSTNNRSLETNLAIHATCTSNQPYTNHTEMPRLKHLHIWKEKKKINMFFRLWGWRQPNKTVGRSLKRKQTTLVSKGETVNMQMLNFLTSHWKSTKKIKSKTRNRDMIYLFVCTLFPREKVLHKWPFKFK